LTQSGHRTYSITSSVRASSAGAVSPREVDVRPIRTVRYIIPQVVRRKFHDDTKRGGTCRQPAKQSFNRKIANEIIALAPASLNLEIVEIGQLSFFNQDLEAQKQKSIILLGALSG
jgi:hypothetical protein